MEAEDPTPTPTPTPIELANEAMQKYGEYVAELKYRYPETFDKLHDFFERGNCRCSKHACLCTEVGMMCDCEIPNTGPHSCNAATEPRCFAHRIKHRVRVYDIETTATTPEGFFKTSGPEHNGQHYFDAGKLDDLEELKKNLQGGSKAKPSSTHFRLITVSQLSANVAKLLGGLYDIHADFFNRHLPGTEAISGRLLSRVPSAIQIEFDELYEANEEFRTLWNRSEDIDGRQGHNLIQDALEQNFLIRQAGWDYFPISDMDWEDGRKNTPMSAGFEDVDARNVFQFNLAHRVSVYSIPKGHKGHPNTAIIVFYPRLTICQAQEHYEDYRDADGSRRRRHRATVDRSSCRPVHFRGIPDTVPPMSDVTHTKTIREQRRMTADEERVYGNAVYPLSDKWDYAAGFDKEFKVHTDQHWKRLHPKNRPTGPIPWVQPPPKLDCGFIHVFGFPLFKIVAANWARLIHKRSLDLDMLEWRPYRDTARSMRTVEESKSRRGAIVRHQKAITATLEMLRHLKQEERTANYKAELEALAAWTPNHHVKLEEIRARYSDDDNAYNKGLSDGLSGENPEGDSWEALYYDFFELKASVDALEKRADKIAESMIGMLNVQIESSNAKVLEVNTMIQKSNLDLIKVDTKTQQDNQKILQVNTRIQQSAQLSDQRAAALNIIIVIVSVVFGSFTIIDTVYSSDFGGALWIAPWNFWVGWTVVLIVLTFFGILISLLMNRYLRSEGALDAGAW